MIDFLIIFCIVFKIFIWFDLLRKVVSLFSNNMWFDLVNVLVIVIFCFWLLFKVCIGFCLYLFMFIVFNELCICVFIFFFDRFRCFNLKVMFVFVVGIIIWWLGFWNIKLWGFIMYSFLWFGCKSFVNVFKRVDFL